ncbi:hypothetical protein JQX08_20175 [Pseudomonas sp. UL073]|uniref:Secreted protein n=1 Tax=Zestomonas insulae TaxID=2809017 RepID=A0ABS2IIZ0_9GAMM|nr:hypothetical protein [Pseudomonas insulae]MBM7063041.1 hypothetical protein [Pseudomonas insulae]
MKRFVILLTASLLAAPAFADELCTTNLQKLDDALATKTPIGQTGTKQAEELKAKAEQAKAAGDEKGCVSHSTQALQLLESGAKGGEGGGS